MKFDLIAIFYVSLLLIAIFCFLIVRLLAFFIVIVIALESIFSRTLWLLYFSLPFHSFYSLALPSSERLIIVLPF